VFLLTIVSPKVETVNGTIATTVNGPSAPPQRITHNSTGIRHQNRVNVTREKQQGTFLSNEEKKNQKTKKGIYNPNRI